MELQILSPSEYVLGLPFDLVIFRGFLPPQWPAGNILVLDPPSGQGIFPLGELTEVSLPPTVREDPLIQDLELESVRWQQFWTMPEMPEGFTEVVSFGDAPSC